MRPALLAALLLVAACGRDAPPVPPLPVKDDPHAAMQAEMEKSSMDFSRVKVVRLQRDGKRLEVSSVAPAIVAEAILHGQAAKTLFRVNDRLDGLILFSRDLPGGISYRTEVSLADLAEKKRFSFPVVQSDGTLKEQTFILERVVSQP